jgi:hypothetical protein
MGLKVFVFAPLIAVHRKRGVKAQGQKRFKFRLNSYESPVDTAIGFTIEFLQNRPQPQLNDRVSGAMDESLMRSCEGMRDLQFVLEDNTASIWSCYKAVRARGYHTSRSEAIVPAVVPIFPVLII